MAFESAPVVVEVLAMAHYGPICAQEWICVLFGLADKSLEWRSGARLLSLKS